MLPGDDYKEIWDRFGQEGEDDFTVTATVVDSDGATSQKGYLLGVGAYFAFSLSRPLDDEVNQFSADISDLFTTPTPTPPSVELLAHLHKYIAVIGRRDSWEILHALDPSMTGHSILCAECKHPVLKSVLDVIHLRVEDGSMPEAFLG